MAEVDYRYIEDCKILAQVAGQALSHIRFEEPMWRKLRDALVPFDNLGKWDPEKSPRLDDDDLMRLLEEDPEDETEAGGSTGG